MAWEELFPQVIKGGHYAYEGRLELFRLNLGFQVLGGKGESVQHDVD